MKLVVVGNVIFSELLGEGMLEALKKRYEAAKDPDTEISYSFAQKGIGACEQNFQIELGATYLLKQVMEVDENKYDGVIIPCGLDPCVISAREYLKIPVVGALSAGLNIASLLGRKITLIYYQSPGTKYAAMDHIKIHSMEAKIASIRYISTPLSSFDSTPEDLTIAEIIAEGRKAITDDGADVIVLGCGAMEGHGKISETLGIPVIQVSIAALKMCELVVKMRLSHSKIAYPFPNKLIPFNVFA